MDSLGQNMLSEHKNHMEFGIEFFSKIVGDVVDMIMKTDEEWIEESIPKDSIITLN